MKWQSITDAGAWDAALRKLPSPHVLQSWAWGEFKGRWGWSAERWLLTDAQAQPRAAAQLLKRGISKLPACVLYAPKGPASCDLETHAEALACIEQRARHHRAIWAKADGDVLFPSPIRGGVGVGVTITTIAPFSNDATGDTAPARSSFATPCSHPCSTTMQRCWRR